MKSIAWPLHPDLLGLVVNTNYVKWFRWTWSKKQNVYLDLKRMRKFVFTKRNTQDATGRHFNSPGHSLSNMSITLERVKSRDPIYRKEREKYHIRKLNSFYMGMNGSPGLGSL